MQVEVNGSAYDKNEKLVLKWADPNPNSDLFYELLSSGKLKGQSCVVYVMEKIIQLNSRCDSDEAEYVRLRTLLDSMTFSTEKGETIKDFLHALRAVIIAIEKRSSCTRK